MSIFPVKRCVSAAFVVFALTLAGHAFATKARMLFNIAPAGKDPGGGLVAWQGSFYGTTSGGGAYDCGTVYQISQSGGVFTRNVVYAFKPALGCGPLAPVTFGKDGNLYGTTARGGASDNGTVFELKPENGEWVETVLYNFQGAPDAGVPCTKLVFDPEGHLYGTTIFGGTADTGSVFKLTPEGEQWTESVIHSSNDPEAIGSTPLDLALDADGSLIGFAQSGGPNQAGVIYRLSRQGDAWLFQIVYDFPNAGDPSYLSGRPLPDASGNLYGSSQLGGSFGRGTFFKFDVSLGVLTVLHNFRGAPNDGDRGRGPLSVDREGRIYGVTVYGGLSIGGTGYGTVYRYTPSNGTYEHVYEFDRTTGRFPLGGLIQDANGNLYGTTEQGGEGDDGLIFQVLPVEK